MEKSDLISVFKSKGVLGPKGKRKYCWKNYWDEECESIFIPYSSNYRTEEEAWFCLLHNIEPPKCEICGDLCVFTGRLKSGNHGYNTVCDKCSANNVESKRISVSRTKKSYSVDRKADIQKKRRATNLEKYGVEDYMCYGTESFKEHMIDKYGDPHYSNHEKAKSTNLERYGVEHNFQIPDYQSKTIKTKIEKYGNASNYEKTKLTNLNRYGYEHIGQVKRFQIQATMSKKARISKLENLYNCTHQQKLVDKYGQGWKSLGLEKICIENYVFIDNSNLDLIEKYSLERTHTNQYISQKEKDVVKYIKSIYGGIILENVTNVASNGNHRYYELDIYLPELNLAFDFNGIYWHSDKFKDKFYHQRKMIACYNQGIQLVHIYEHIWDNDEDCIKMMIKKMIEDPSVGYLFNSPHIRSYRDYDLTDPERLEVKYGNNEYVIYNEGKFIKRHEKN